MRVVLCRTTNHRWSANVDQFNRRFRRERIEVGNDKVDCFDAVLLHIGAMFRIGWVGQDATVNLRMQRDDAMAKDGWESGEIGDIGDRNAGFSDDACRATAGNEIPTECIEFLGELNNAGLVVNGQKSPHWTLPLSMMAEIV